MMVKITKAILNSHAQNYIRAVMKDQLIKDGYISRNGQDLHWYRIVDGNILQAIYFYSQWAALPMFMGIAYGCHPLFISPEYPAGVHMPSMLRSMEAVNPGRYILKQSGNTLFSPSAMVNCPSDLDKGADILASMLEELNQVRTIEHCYDRHKQHYLDVAQATNISVKDAFCRCMAPDFMDEAVFVNDFEIYPYCMSRIESELHRYETAQQKRKLWNVEKADFEALHHLKTAIIDGDRDAHLSYLQTRKDTITAQLKRRVKGLIV